MSKTATTFETKNHTVDRDNVICLKLVQIAIVISLVWKLKFFIAANWAHEIYPLEDPFFPWLLQQQATARVAWTLATLCALLVLFTKTQNNIFRLTAISFVSLAVLSIHQKSYNDVTFMCCAWSSLWCLWMSTRIHESFESLFPRSSWSAQLILSMIFIGGAVGKVTPGYWNGTVLHEIYYIDRDFWTYNLIRSCVAEESLPTIAMWHSRFVICAEWLCGCLWLMPRKLASFAAIAMLCGIALTNNTLLFSVVTCLLGLALVGLHEKKADSL